MIGSIGSLGLLGFSRGRSVITPGGGGDPGGGTYNAVRLLAGHMYHDGLGSGGSWTTLKDWGGGNVTVDVADSIQQIVPVGSTRFFGGIYSTAVISYDIGSDRFGVHGGIPGTNTANNEKCGTSYSNGIYTAIYEAYGLIYSSTDLSAWENKGGGNSAFGTTSLLAGRIGSDGAGTLIRLAVNYNTLTKQQSVDHGATWTENSSVLYIPSGYYSIVCAPVHVGSGTWIAVGSVYGDSHDGPTFAVKSVDNGATWSLMSAGPPAGYYPSLAYGNGVLLAVGWGGKIARSTDGGETWTAVASPYGTRNGNDITFVGGRFFICGGDGSGGQPFVFWTTDGTAFTEESTGGSIELYAVAGIDLGIPAA